MIKYKSRFMILSLSMAALLMVSNSCVPDLVGSKEDEVLSGATFVVDTTYTSYSSLVAKGRITNSGSTTYDSPWYVEAQFYADGTHKLKLGGDSYFISFPLDPGQTCFWQLNFSSSIIEEQDYPNFDVSDLRAVRH